ncbi:K+-transporting ATPase ATPase C chain [Luteibacter sp. Sphag1AF]|uniref:potassium-transporting ATPase subunit KdpC n=1 Tax=Luteibacter sp. Sphag1AF TaxID=2587031 RepID=UPI001610CDBA|nr:potassium-transporting ATPase subunit KdpC [Luteibacter sp. Sphag1AF]MBB3227648.1 K+-transporting ATPase ATPase C chain [Luteibacter sp. Sphag1AF]
MNSRYYTLDDDGIDTTAADHSVPHASGRAKHGGSGVIWPSIVFALIFVVLCGLVYPVIATLAGHALFPVQAEGSLVRDQGRVIGSALVAQPFTSDRYFSPRPSAAGYDMLTMAGSNLSPGNPDLHKAMSARAAAFAKREGIPEAAVPADMVTASGSGIDPDISLVAARLQAPRIAHARHMPVAQVQALVDASTRGPTFGALGQTRVNVLELNMALDRLAR